MSSHKERGFDMRRSKDTMSDYRSAPAPKSRNDMGSHKKNFSSRGPPMEEKHREFMKPSKRSIEIRREYDERKDYPPVKKTRERFQSSSKESYGRGARDDPFEAKSRDPYLSRGGGESFSGKSTRGSMSGRGSYGSSARGGRGSFGSSRGDSESYPVRSSKPPRDSYPSRGSYGYPRGSRESYSSRGSFASSRGRGEGFSSRGRESFSSRGREVGRGREPYSVRGRESYQTRGSATYSSRGRDSYSTRGRDSYPSRGRNSYPSRGRDSYPSRGRDSFPSRGMKTSSRGGYLGSKRVSKYDDFPSNSSSSRGSYPLMSKKMSAMNEDHYEDERMYEMKRSSHTFSQKDSARTFKEPTSASRSFSHHHSSSSLSHGEKFAHKRERSSSASGHYDKERYSDHLSKRKTSKDKFASQTKRSYDEDDDDQIGHRPKDHRDGPPHKQQRLLKKEKYREADSQEYRRNRSVSPLNKEKVTHEPSRERDRSKSSVQERVKKREGRASKGSVGAVDGATDVGEEVERRRGARVKSRKLSGEDISAEEDVLDDLHEQDVLKEAKVKPPHDEEPDESFEERRRERSPGGVQITIRSDGERAVNSDGGFVKSRLSGRVFIDLHCPHCKGQTSITFKEYRYHLDSGLHRHNIEKLAYKHSNVLRGIRKQQRQEQKDIEEKWEEEKPEEFKDVISGYCKKCKLAYKSLPGREDEHNKSKLHLIQQRYLHPNCVMCRMSFPSRMVYEYHLASIKHLRMLSSLRNKNGLDGTPEDESKEEGKEEIDLTNFITMDSVGEDEEVGSEKEEITGKLEDLEKAEVDAKEGEEEEEDEDEHADEEELPLHEDEDDDFGIDVEDENDYLDQDEEQLEPDGKDYIEPMEAVYCKLCHKALRLDTEIGEDIIDKHCSTPSHLENLNYANAEFMDGGEERFVEETTEDFGEDEPVVDVVVKKELDIGEGEEENVEEDREEFVDEEEPNYEEDIEEHGEDIDLDSKISISNEEQNGK